MAFIVTCDVTACGAEISAGPGQPTLQGKRQTYCARCAGYIAAVDAELDKITTLRSMELANELEALRRKMIAQALPQQLGGEPANRAYITVPQ